MLADRSLRAERLSGKSRPCLRQPQDGSRGSPRTVLGTFGSPQDSSRCARSSGFVLELATSDLWRSISSVGEPVRNEPFSLKVSLMRRSFAVQEAVRGPSRSIFPIREPARNEYFL